MAKLFRQEAMEWKGNSWLGIVHLRPKASLTYSACICATMILGFVALLTAGTYSQRLKLAGLLIAAPRVSQSEPQSTRLFVRFLVPATAIVALGPRTSIPLTFLGLSSRDLTPPIGQIVSVTPVTLDVERSTGVCCVVLVRLPQPNVSVRGRVIPLSAGMRVSTDVLIEKRTLLAWLTGPRAPT